MAINFIESEKKQIYLIWVLIIVVLITILVLWFGLLRKKEASPLPEENLPAAPIGELPKVGLGLPSKIEINFEVLDNPLLKKLQIFEELKSFEGEIGRENPFIPH